MLALSLSSRDEFGKIGTKSGPRLQGTHDQYEDYSEGYAQGPYFDTGTSSFVMPYAQPVSRRIKSTLYS
jgi:hypothetical protein